MSKIGLAVLDKASFEVGAQEADHEKWSLWLEKLSIISQMTESRAIANDPKISQTTIVTLLAKVLMTHDQQCLSLLALLNQYRLFKKCPALLEQYTKLIQSAQNSATIQVTSAHKLAKNDRDNILKQLRIVFSVDKIDAEFDINPAMISGFHARWADKTYYASLKNKLDQIQHHLT